MTLFDYLLAAPWWHWLFIVIIVLAVARIMRKMTFFKIDKRTEEHTHTHSHQHIHNPEKK